jgi:hypothetical protein
LDEKVQNCAKSVPLPRKGSNDQKLPKFSESAQNFNHRKNFGKFQPLGFEKSEHLEKPEKLPKTASN